MNSQGPERTQLTDAMLKETTGILNDIIHACNACLAEKISWSQACRRYGLDPLKTRSSLLNGIGKCVNQRKPLSDVVDMREFYDGYEKFYQAIFGDRTMTEGVIPFDYKETVIHVLRNTGLTDMESDILMHHFGICDYEIPISLTDIAKDMELSREAVRQIEAKAMRKCRVKHRADMFRMGITKYNLMKEYKKQQQKQMLEHEQKEHEAMLAKQEKEHKTRMAIITSKSYEEAGRDIMPSDIIDVLIDTDISILEFSTRTHNALRRADIENLFELLKHYDREKLLMIRNLGEGSASEIMTKLDIYMKENYYTTAETMKTLCCDSQHAFNRKLEWPE